MRNIIITLLFLIIFPFNLLSQSKQEIRATWITTFGGLDWPQKKSNGFSTIEIQKKELIDILDKLKQANINTILFQTRVRGDLIYPSNIETFTESLTGHEGKDPGYDPLNFAISEAHKRGMQLHAWIVTIPVGNSRQVKILGKNSVVYKKKDICKYHEGNWYLDPGNPKTKEYLASIVKEVINKYDVDGIHLDYIRYPENANKFDDKDTYRKYGNGENFKDWRRNNITSIVKRVYNEVKSYKPWIVVSSSPIGKYYDTNRYSSMGWNAYSVVYQDAQKWLKDGIMDALFPMMYFRDNNFYPFALDWKENNNSRWIIPGLGIYFLSPKEKNWPLEEISRQIYFIRKHNLNGEAFFRTKFLLDNYKKLLDELNNKTFKYPSLIPPMKWIDSIPPTIPTNANIDMVNNKISIKWTSSKDNSNLPVKYNVYASYKYPVDINAPQNLVYTYLDSTSFSISIEKETIPYRYYAVTAIDKYGNESLPLSINPKGKIDIDVLNNRNILNISTSHKYKKILITTITNDILLNKDFSDSIKLDNLTPGLYVVKGLRENGEIDFIGNIVL